jgi:hypothetical protein
MTGTGEAVNQENSPSGAENPELAECALVRDLAFWLQLSSSWAYLRIYSGQSFKFA